MYTASVHNFVKLQMVKYNVNTTPLQNVDITYLGQVKL